jgi:hypothetical protein
MATSPSLPLCVWSLGRATTGFAACNFTESIDADLPVMPAPQDIEVAVPSMMDWVLQVTPCSLWIVREN